MSFIDLHLTRSNQKIAYRLIFEHIQGLKSRGFEGKINSLELASVLQIPFKTVQRVMHDLHDQGHIMHLQQI